MKKKLLTVLLVGAMALNITACGGSSDAAAVSFRINQG